MKRPSKSDPKQKQWQGTVATLIIAAALCWWVRGEINANREKQRIGENNRALVEQAQQEAKTRRNAETRAFIEALKISAQTRANTHYCTELCQGRGRDANAPITAAWEHNGLGDCPIYGWTSPPFVATLLAPTHHTNAPYAWPQNATVLLKDYGALIAFEHILPFYFPYAGGQYNRIAISTSGLIFFDCMAYPRGNSWPLSTPRHGDALSALAVYYDEWQLVQGSTIETFSTNTLNGAIQGQAFRWKDMAKSGANAGNDRVTFGAILWENGDVDTFIEGDTAKLSGIVGAQHHGASWTMPSVASGDRFTFSRLLDFEEAGKDLAGDGLNRHTKWLWYLDETNPSFARDGVADAFKLRYNLCPHEPSAYVRLVTGGLFIIDAFRHNCDPWKVRGDGVTLTYNQSIANGYDPHSNWRPAVDNEYDAEDIVFLLATGDTPGVFTFSGVDGDPRVQQWTLQTNETQTVTIKAWVNCENIITAGSPGATVALVGNHYSMGFATGNAPAPQSAAPLKAGGPGLAPMMTTTSTGGNLGCFEMWKKTNFGNPYPTYWFSFKLCYPPPPEPRGFSVTFADTEWCLAGVPPVYLWHTNSMWALTAQESQAYVPCNCAVFTGATPQAAPDKLAGYIQYVASGATPCVCVRTGGATCLVLQAPKIKIISITKNFSPDKGETMTVVFEIENYIDEMANHYYLTVDAVQPLRASNRLIENLTFASGSMTQAVNTATHTITWGGVLSQRSLVGLMAGRGEFDGRDQDYDEVKMPRIMPEASINTIVPGPFFDVEIKAWHKCPRTNGTAHEVGKTNATVHVKQLVVARCMDSAISEMAEPIYNGDNEIIYPGRPGEEVAMAGNVLGFIASKVPAGANVEYLNWHTHGHLLQTDANGDILKGNVKMVEIHAQSSLQGIPGFEPTTVDETGKIKYQWAFVTGSTVGNYQRFGTAYINLNAFRYEIFKEYEYLVDEEGKTHAEAIAAFQGKMDMVLGFGSTHEVGHLLGLVSVDFLYGAEEDEPEEGLYYVTHNRIENHPARVAEYYIMDPEWQFSVILEQGEQIEFIQLNKDYILFVLPQPQGD